MTESLIHNTTTPFVQTKQYRKKTLIFILIRFIVFHVMEITQVE